jgi:hypothetical protein
MNLDLDFNEAELIQFLRGLDVNYFVRDWITPTKAFVSALETLVAEEEKKGGHYGNPSEQEILKALRWLHGMRGRKSMQRIRKKIKDKKAERIKE